MPRPRTAARTTALTPAITSFRRRAAFCFSGETASELGAVCSAGAGSALRAEAGSLPCSVVSLCSVMAGPHHAMSSQERYLASIPERCRQRGLVGVHDEPRQQPGRLSLAGIGADGVTLLARAPERPCS